MDSTYFQLHLQVLRIFGINAVPIKNPTKRTLYYLYACIFLTFQFSYTCLELIQVISLFPNVINMCYSMCFLFSRILGLIKSGFVWKQRRIIWRLFKRMEHGNFLPNLKTATPSEGEFIKSALKFCNLQGVCFYSLTLIIIFLLSLAMTYSSESVGEYFDEQINSTVILKQKMLPFKIYIPVDYQSSPTYEFFFLTQVLWSIGCGMQIGAVDALLYGSMLFFKAQFLILKQRIRNLPDKPDEIKQFIRDCIGHHQELLDLCKDAEDVFRYLLLSQFLASLLILCMSLFQLSLNLESVLETVSMAIYLALMMYQIFFYCWHGNELRLVSDMTEDIYHANWIGENFDLQRSLLVIMLRTQRPSQLTAGKFVFLSIQTFITVVKGSFSYFTVLRQMNN